VPQFDQWMAAAGLTPSARRKLERWGYDPFAHARELPYVVDEGEPIARYANLLDRLQVADEPPEMFTQLACLHSPGAPEWFHRALLAEIVRLSDEDPGYPCPDAFERALPWLASNPPAPDANQARGMGVDRGAGVPIRDRHGRKHAHAMADSVRRVRDGRASRGAGTHSS
jgi:hypothetical protein